MRFAKIDSKIKRSYPVVTLKATHVASNLIQINDFVNEQGYFGRGQKLVAIRLLRVCSHDFFLKVDTETDTKITALQCFLVGKHNKFCMSIYAQINKVYLRINNYVFMRFCFEC